MWVQTIHNKKILAWFSHNTKSNQARLSEIVNSVNNYVNTLHSFRNLNEIVLTI